MLHVIYDRDNQGQLAEQRVERNLEKNEVGTRHRQAIPPANPRSGADARADGPDSLLGNKQDGQQKSASGQSCLWLSDEAIPQSEIARKRREQIMDAAEAIIAHHGIARLSLKRIEKLAGMSRGQLLYYFPNKEAILLAVYERMIRRMIQERLAATDLPQPGTGQAWLCLQRALEEHLGLGPKPIESKQELFSLLYTFIAQMSYRDDYRQRLSTMYRRWREHIAADIASSVALSSEWDPRILACIIQALIHGLTVQLLVDPNAFDRQQMLQTCLQMLAPFYGPQATTPTTTLPISPLREESP